MLTDTHTHIYLPELAAQLPQIIQRANEVGVNKFYLPAIDSTNFNNLLATEAAYPAQCFAMAGLHPCYVSDTYKQELAYVHQQLQQRRFVAIGEIGLDYYHSNDYVAQQKVAFTLQMQWALDYNLPISIHTRNAMSETINMVKPFANKGLRGIFHCFGGSAETAKEIIAMGFYLGIGGVVTYKNAGLQDVLQSIDTQHLVLETDAPYLSPVPHRGKPNEPSYLNLVAQKIAEIKNITYDDVAAITTKNAANLFG